MWQVSTVSRSFALAAESIVSSLGHLDFFDSPPSVHVGSASLRKWARHMHTLTMNGASYSFPGMVPFAEAATGIERLDLYTNDQLTAAQLTYLLPSFKTAFNVLVNGDPPSAFPLEMTSLEVDFDGGPLWSPQSASMLLYKIARCERLARLVMILPDGDIQLACPLCLPVRELTFNFKLAASTAFDLSWLQHQPYSELNMSINASTDVYAQHERLVSQLLPLRLTELIVTFAHAVPRELQALWQQVSAEFKYLQQFRY